MKHLIALAIILCVGACDHGGKWVGVWKDELENPQWWEFRQDGSWRNLTTYQIRLGKTGSRGVYSVTDNEFILTNAKTGVVFRGTWERLGNRLVLHYDEGFALVLTKDETATLPKQRL